MGRDGGPRELGTKMTYSRKPQTCADAPGLGRRRLRDRRPIDPTTLGSRCRPQSDSKPCLTGGITLTEELSPATSGSGSRCVYTALIGRYEQLVEQPRAGDSAIPYICLTDDPELRSDTWQIRVVTPTFELDPNRSQRDFKIRPYLHLAEFGRSLYIDNTVRLTADPEELFALVPDDVPLALAPHSFRESVLDEFLAVASAGLDDQSRIFEQLNHYQLSSPSILEKKPWWTGMLVRDHRHAAVRQMGELWLAHVLRYSRRDQLSVNVALQQAGLVPHALEFDNQASAYHTWPHVQDRDRTGVRRPMVSHMPPPARIRAAELALAEQAISAATVEEALTHERGRASDLEQSIASAEERLVALNAYVAELERLLAEERALSLSLLTSTSWRLTAPARAVGSLVRDALGSLLRLGARLEQDAAVTRARLVQTVTRLRGTDLREELFHGYFGLVYRIRRWSGGRRRLPAGPDPVIRSYLLWKVTKLLGVEIVPLADDPMPLAFHFHDTTVSRIESPASARVLNDSCRDVSKRRVDRAMTATFGYGLALDPTMHSGPMVEKSDRNAAHDGVVIEGPIASPDPTKVYQRVVDNEIVPGIVEDWRSVIVAQTIPVVFRKRRRIHERFADVNLSAKAVPAESVFSDEECQQIIAFAGHIGLDMGMLDVVRDRRDGRIYVLDVNHTPFAPPKVARTPAGIRAIHRVASAFEREWGGLLS